MRTTLSYLFALSTLVSVAFAAGAHQEKRQHKGVFRRLNTTNETHSLEKRGFSGRWTYFADGLGACGKWNKPSDFIVALNTPQYGYGSPGPQCFKMITMSYGGKTTQAQIMDECPTCGWGELDLSEGLFKFFADTSLGVINGQWSFGGGDGGNNDPPPPKNTPTKPDPPKWTPPAPKSTKADDDDKPTSTPKARVQTSSSASKTSTKSKASSTTSAKASSVKYNAGVGAGLAKPTGSPVPSNSSEATGALEGLNQAVIRLGSLISAGAQ